MQSFKSPKNSGRLTSSSFSRCFFRSFFLDSFQAASRFGYLNCWTGTVLGLVAVAAFSSTFAGCAPANGTGSAKESSLVQPTLEITPASGYSFSNVRVVVVLPLSAGVGVSPPSKIELEQLTKQLISSLEVYSRFRVLNAEEQDKITGVLSTAQDLEDGGLSAAAKVGRQVDADLVISGVISDFGGTKSGRHGGEVKEYQSEGNLNLRLWLTDTKTGRIAATISYQKRRDSATDNLFNAREALSGGIVSKNSTEVSKTAFVQIAKKVDALK